MCDSSLLKAGQFVSHLDLKWDAGILCNNLDMSCQIRTSGNPDCYRCGNVIL